MVYGVIYKVTCLVNGKCYHGQTVNPDERWSHHQRSSSHCLALRNAIAKYGAQNFVFDIVAEASSKEELDELEKQFVATSIAPAGYNLKEGGANGRPSAETRRKLSVSGKVAQNRPEVKAKNSAGVRKAMARPEVKEKHREALKRALARPETKERHQRAMREVLARPGEKEKRGASIQASWASYSEDEREQRLQAHRASVQTEAYRENMRQVSLISLARPEVKKKLKAAIQKSWTPERREQLASQMREAHAKPGDKEARGAAISKSQNTPEGKAKLARRRRRGESIEAWEKRISCSGVPPAA